MSTKTKSKIPPLFKNDPEGGKRSRTYIGLDCGVVNSSAMVIRINLRKWSGGIDTIEVIS